MNGRKRRDPTMEEGTFLVFPEINIPPMELEDLLDLDVNLVQNNGHQNKTHGALKLRDIIRKMM